MCHSRLVPEQGGVDGGISDKEATLYHSTLVPDEQGGGGGGTFDGKVIVCQSRSPDREVILCLSACPDKEEMLLCPPRLVIEPD